MRQAIEDNLSAFINRGVVTSLLETHAAVITEYRSGDLDACLTKAGKFVEHTLRAIEYVRTGIAPHEIRNAASVIQQIEKDRNLPESLRLLVPRVAHSMIYEMRSKRGAVHVKEIDPRAIDAALCTLAASWILAEFLRLYHSDSEQATTEAMASLMRVHIPMIEVFGNEVVVTSKVPCDVELLLLIARSAPAGLDRRSLGISSRFSPSSVTQTLQRLEKDIFVHQTKEGLHHITGPGENYLMNQLTEQGFQPVSIRRGA